MSRCESHDFAGLPDEGARLRIVEGLQDNLLVEAGAGSGKTTAMVQRMVSLVRTGACEVRQIAAVTFTRKAAAELRQRFQVALECALVGVDENDPTWSLLTEAVQHIDEAFLGTIHAFCAKLLRERPLEAGLDPGFREVLESEAYRMQKAFWVEFLERLAADGDPDLGQLAALGIEAKELEDVFGRMVENPDVVFMPEANPEPDLERVARVRREFEALLDRALAMMPDEEPAAGWDPLATKIRRWAYLRRARDWSRIEAFLDVLSQVRGLRTKLTQNRWSDTGTGKAAAKELQKDFHAFGALGGDAAELVEAWWAHRYPVAIRLAQRGAMAFAERRRDEGTLNFQDLLVLTARLLRTDPVARHDLGDRYRRLLVDEFQDTDPLQAEIILLLASNPGSSAAGSPAGSVAPEGGLNPAAGVLEDWRDVIPRPGSLFVVGDPKQSIYRFRRADISLYEFVKERFAAFGDCLRLEANFRSLPRFEELVDGVFRRDDAFPDEGTGRQAGYAPLVTRRDESAGFLGTYSVQGITQAEIAADDAARIAACIAKRVKVLGDRSPGDFMILTRNRKFLSVYARAIEDQGLPVEVSGAGVGFEEELQALLLLLRTLADPENAVRVLGTITGPLFGVTLDHVLTFRDGGGRLSISRPPEGEGPAVEALAVLHRWWQAARRQPADLAIEGIIRETGLFPAAAAGQLGQLRAGALSYVLDAVRARTLAGDPSIHGAVDAMETALAWDDAEAPLIPGRRGAVQVMNLHRAKGLEAPVVFLAAPFGDGPRSAEMRVARDSEGVAVGSLAVVRSAGWSTDVVAQPLSWPDDLQEENAFQEAEKVRLLYVAATRARDELWVARGAGLPGGVKPSAWLPIEEWLDRAGNP
ncbi:MAG: UvrD-helicase domain-containing protein, partial [Gemmatimonadota bacterium]|nr:UvrD-helicase domain-containing protein [Gemmatimonadota bacterium]